MSGSPPPRSSQLPSSPTGFYRPRRIRKPPDYFGSWVSDKCHDLVLSSGGEESDDEDSISPIVQPYLTPHRLNASRLTPQAVVTTTPSGPPPARVAGLAFSPPPFNISLSPAFSPTHRAATRVNRSVSQQSSPTMSPNGSLNLLLSQSQEQVQPGHPILNSSQLGQDQANFITPPSSPSQRGSPIITPPPSTPPSVPGLAPVTTPSPVPTVPVPLVPGHAPQSQDSSQTIVSQELPLPPLQDLPSLEEVHRTFVPTVTWVPKAARAEFTRVFTSQCNRVAFNPEKISAWVLQLMFAKCILPAVKHRPDSNQSKAVKERLARWRRADYRALWEEAVEMTKLKGKSRKKTQDQQISQEERNSQRASRLAQQGEYTRACQAITSAGLAEHTAATVREMKAKHPPPLSPTSFQSQDDSPQMSFSKEQVIKAIRSFKKGSAPGPDGLRAEHLKVAIKLSPPNRQDKAADAITKLVNTMGAGAVPLIVAPYLSGACLHAGLKKDGGIRPIAVGNILRRLTSKCVMRGVADRAANLLGPHQLGVGVRGGLEAIIHSMRHVVEGGQVDTMVLQLDLINAFNCCDCDSAFHVVEDIFPDILQWVLTCYGSDAELIFGKTIISSTTGFHQGDPLAGFLFSLTLHPIVEMIQQQVPTLIANEWYLDDGGVAGQKEELQAVVDILLHHGPARGLILSTAANCPRPKSTIWYPCPTAAHLTNLDPLDRGIPLVIEDGIVLLGSPIGSIEFEKQAINKRIDKVREISEMLPRMKDAQSEYVLLRSCLSIPKIMFTLRTTNPFHHQDLWQRFDNITRETISMILGVPVNDGQWLQAQLPVSKGGLGLRASMDHAPAAYISSLLSSQDLKESILSKSREECPPRISSALIDQLAMKMGEDTSIISIQSVPQKIISLKIDLHNLQLLENNITGLGVTRDIARLASLGLPHSGDWLNVVPSPALGLHLRPAEFIVSVKYRLGMDIFSRDGQCTACPLHSDARGDHAISCGYEGERISRHNHLRDAIYNTAVQACLGPTREDRALIPGSDARPADVLIPNWSGGRDTAMDVTVVNPLQAALVNIASTTPGHALTKRFNEKMTKHGENCRRAGMVFLPLPMETLGGWHDQTVSLVKRLGSALARQTGQDESEAIRHFAQRLAVLLAKGNSALLLNRIPTYPSPDIDGQD